MTEGAVNLPPPPKYEFAILPTDEQAAEAAERTESRNRRTNRTPRTFKMEKGPLICIGVVVAFVAIMLVALLPPSFQYLEYHEYGFRRRRSSGAVDRDQVYGPGGRYFFGVDFDFKVFPADNHQLNFKRVAVFTKDRLEVTITVDIQYYLRKHQLVQLHKTYDLHYKSVVQNNALDALKGAATAFTTREFIRDRNKVEQGLTKAIKERLGGRCCEKGCERRGDCMAHCTKYSDCGVEESGLYVEARYVHLNAVDIPDKLGSQYLQALILQEETEKEQFNQDSKLVRKATETKIKRIENEANEIEQDARAKAALIESVARANSTAILEEARGQGLELLYSDLGLTTPQHKASFDYLRMLGRKENVQLSVDYQQLINGYGGIGHN